ncbi:MAG TPA: glycosyltransferase family 4 protein [Vicinamibacterales bacterium]|nr:glycosyltransferase family 4 protein [Vicinamibacterales bacterium]
MLALLPFSEEGASVRFRVSQFLPALSKAGFDVDLHPLFDTALFRLLYRPGHVPEKATALLSRTFDRVKALRDEYDVALIHREAYPVGPPLIERWLARRVPIVYDFDDAVYLPNTSDANKMIGFLKRPAKIAEVVRLSSEVIAGNPHLGDYARRYTRNVSVIPTCVDTSLWAPSTRPRREGPPVIGWIGTPTTTPYLMGLQDVLGALAKEQEFVLRVSGSVKPIEMRGVRIENEPWSLEREIELFNTCDIGVYPLPNDEWTLGKCGFKAIQFMACGVPAVASPVGVNNQIIQDGVSGLLANTEAEWRDALRKLLVDAELRRRVAAAGRRRIEEAYSLQANAPSVVSVFERAARKVHAHA